MNFALRILYFWAGIDTSILKWCPAHERQKYSSIGILVLLTGSFAFMASGYAFMTVFKSPAIALSLGALWAIMILNLDRLMLTTFPKGDKLVRQVFHAIPRLVLATIIGITIAHPVVLRLFEPEIKARITEEDDIERGDRRQDKLDQIEQELAEKEEKKQLLVPFTTMTQRKDALDNVTSELNQCSTTQRTSYSDAKCEADGNCGTGNFGAGPVFKAKKEIADKIDAGCERLRGEVKEAQTLLDAAQKELDQAAKPIERDSQERELEINKDYLIALDHIAQKEPSFLRESEALSHLSEKSPHISTMRTAVSILFIFVEIVPIFVKLIAPKDSADDLARSIHDSFSKRIPALATRLADTGNPTPTPPPPPEDRALTPTTTLKNRIIATVITVTITTIMLAAGSKPSEAFEAGALFIGTATLFVEYKRRSTR